MSATARPNPAPTGATTLQQRHPDPTRSKTLRQRYARRLRGWFGRLNATIREAVVSEDVFRLRSSTEALEEDPSLPDRAFPFSREGKRRAFLAWLRREERRGVLEIVTRGDNEFVRAAYAKGINHADDALNAEGVRIPEAELAAIFNAPMHRRALSDLFRRNFANLAGITEEMNRQIAEELTEGFALGENPTKIARRINGRVDAVGKHRATVLARTEVIHAHSEATLNRYEEFGVRGVSVQAEWSTAGDDRVCPICATLEGETFTLERARNGRFPYEAGDDEPPSLSGNYSLQPPAHPQCRCSLLPVIT